MACISHKSKIKQRQMMTGIPIKIMDGIQNKF